MPDQLGATMLCPLCNSTMAATQNERGTFYVCGHCKHEIPVSPQGSVEE